MIGDVNLSPVHFSSLPVSATCVMKLLDLSEYTISSILLIKAKFKMIPLLNNRVKNIFRGRLGLIVILASFLVACMTEKLTQEAELATMYPKL